MRLTIENKPKQEMFVALFQLLKNWSSIIIMHFEPNRLYIQSMDKSHICLADIEIKNTWFTEYNCLTDSKLSVDANNFAILLNYALKHDSIELKYDDQDKLYINFLNGAEKKMSFDNFFELNLVDIEDNSLHIPTVDYDVEFTIETKKFVDVLAQLNVFGTDLNIKCNENALELYSSGDSTKLKVNIPIDDLNEYAISEGEEMNISYSLNHICKMCTSLKLCSTVDVSLSSEYPMSLKYNLGEGSKVNFYIAPKIE
jgi:proliferating cell nuclear antigen